MTNGPLRLSVVEVFRHLSPADLAEIERGLSLVPVARGQALVRQGELADALFIVVSGRFKVVREGRRGIIAEIGAGAPIGEIAFFAGGERTATVTAERDSLVLELKREDFDRLAGRSPHIWNAITTELARRLGAVTASGSGRPAVVIPRTITVCRAGGAAGQSGVAEGVVAGLRAALAPGLRVHVLDAAAALQVLDSRIPLASSEATQWFNALEGEWDHVIYICDPELTEWSKKALRQADLVLCVGRRAGGVSHDPNLLELFAERLHGKGTLRLVLAHEGRAPYDNTRAWLDARPWVDIHHHVGLSAAGDTRPADTGGYARLVRFIRGAAIGLVACGGGAYSAAHIGLFDALADAGIEFDIVGGTSGGAAMAAGIARGVSTDEMAARTQDIFVARKAMRRWTWPRYSLLDHAAFDRALEHHFTAIDIEDLGLPYYAVATNLSRNAVHCIRRGPLWLAVRTSAAIPAVLPPVFSAQGEMLVDGMVSENVPLKTILGLKSGPNVVIDFASPVMDRYEIDSSKLPGRGALIARLFSGGGKSLPVAPGPQEVLLRALLSNRPDYVRDLCSSDILLTPHIPASIGQLDWHRHRELRTIARDYAGKELARLKSEGHELFTPSPAPPTQP